MAAENTDPSTGHSDEGQRDRSRGSERSERHRFADNPPEPDGTVPGSDQLDVLLDVPVLKVDEIKLKVEELRARVSLQAEVLDLVRLNVGADVFIGQVGLEIKGVEAQALLKVRLDNVARILERVLTTIDRHPEIVEQITAGVRSAVEDVGGGAGRAVGELGESAGTAVEQVGEGAGSAVEEVGQGAGSAVEDVGGSAGSAVEDVGESAGSAVEDTGETARRTARGAGKAARRAAGAGEKTAEDSPRGAQKDSEGRAAKRPGASGRSRVVKRSKGQSNRRTGAPDDRSPRS